MAPNFSASPTALRAARRFAVACAAVLAGALVAASPIFAAPSAKACSALAKSLKPKAKLKKALARLRSEAPSVELARWVDASPAGPAHCFVTGFLYTSNAAAPRRIAELNRVRFQLRMPTSWNQKLHFRGVGGYGGEFPTLPAGAIDPLALGYATAGTDTGHTGNVGDASFAADATKLADFYDRGVHAATVGAKKVIAAYYGAPAQRAYFEGCSGGGRQAVWEAMAYPADFDGIIAGAPAGTADANATGAWNQAHVYPDANQLASPALPVAKLAALGQAVLARCDAVDGIADGILEDPRACDFDAARDAPQCAPGDEANAACLSPAESAVANAIYQGPDVGPPLRGPLPGGEIGPLGWQIWIVQNDFTALKPTLQYAFTAAFFQHVALAPKSFRDLDFATRQVQLPAVSGIRLDRPLAAYQARGGKLLLWHGWNDPVLSPLGTVELFDDIGTELGPVTRDDFARLYMMPGVYHCADEPSLLPGPALFDALGALERWVENGERPDALIASHPLRGTRPICPYPQRATRIDPSGDAFDAANFRCE